MKKRILFLLTALTLSMASFAQFEQGKTYINGNISGLNAKFNGSDKWKIDLGFRGGYMVEDSWMLMGELDYNYRKYEPKTFALGAGVRYYIAENGLYLGAGAKFANHSFDGESTSDFLPNIQIGYVFFLNKSVALEPEFYYEQSLKDHSNYSNVGFRVGIGVFLDDLLKF